MTFAHIKPVALPLGSIALENTGTVEIADGFTLQLNNIVPQYIEHKFIKDKASPPNNGRLDVYVENLQLTEFYEPRGSKLVQFFEVSGFDVVTFAMTVDIRFSDIRNYEAYGTQLKLERIIRIPEHASLARREAMHMQLIEHVILDLDAQVEKLIAELF